MVCAPGSDQTKGASVTTYLYIVPTNPRPDHVKH